MESLRSFEGDVVGVNPNYDEVLGFPSYESVEAVPDGTRIDLAVVVVPPDSVAGVVETLGERGVVNVVVVTAGFSEAGGEGAEREENSSRLRANTRSTLSDPTASAS